MDINEIQHIALLARLDLREDEMERFASQIGNILSYAEKLNTICTDEVEPTAHVLGMRNVFRDDDEAGSFAREAILANAPEASSGCFRVPKIIGQD
ncbi:MAG: Asp-tRNA(Asn)/Glu-tRNA(Gln) amidotransferase subunit GatC [Nitrospirae bacterium]|nr:Asp-tRNA(Asn)/Glu-tRNA(Gln) amidotransferase subunit GatC [Nitrospirota bacterium]